MPLLNHEGNGVIRGLFFSGPRFLFFSPGVVVRQVRTVPRGPALFPSRFPRVECKNVGRTRRSGIGGEAHGVSPLEQLDGGPLRRTRRTNLSLRVVYSCRNWGKRVKRERRRTASLSRLFGPRRTSSTGRLIGINRSGTRFETRE